MPPTIKIESYAAGDKAVVLKLLSEADLPTSDLNAEILKNFLIAREPGGAVAGIVGMEAYQDVGLLRSLVVRSSHRGQGLGALLTAEMEKKACKKGVKSFYLLTLTAIDYFPKLNYRVTQRSSVPEAIAATTEFKNICPASAVCYSKNLKINSK